ncbi:MAG: glutamine synthetase [Desulfobacteraceae bacterium 4572_123]|nr:MAG: glutamine synthetase [Desulfobacteraceae bacterium 4572_123]
MPGIGEIKQKLKETDSTKIFFTDLRGRLMSLPVNGEHIESIVRDGIGFDGSSIAGMATVDNSDKLLFPAIESFKTVELNDEKLGFFIGRIYDERETRAKADPRVVLEDVLIEAETEYGFKFIVGPEHEFFLLTGDEFGKKDHSDRAGYFNATPQDKGESVRNRIISVLRKCGIQFEKAHHEVTPSQHEINLLCTDPIDGADRTVLFNYVTKKVAQEFGYHATFMPKPFDGFNRNAFHIHLSMLDMKGNNLFYDAGANGQISKTALHFIGGIMKYARETSIIMASTFNSYKAYVLEREAPMIKSWGFRNRSSMVRIPYSNSPENTRIELRSPDPAGNVYLQMATLIAMGLQGIKEELDCGRPDVGSTYNKNFKTRVFDKRFLPRSLYEALVEAEKGQFLKQILGESLYTNYMKLKIDDWEGHRTHVTPRELNNYLDS